MKPTDDPSADPAEALAPPEVLGDLRQRAEDQVAARRQARRDVEKRIEEELNQLSEQLAEELERRREEAEQEARAAVGGERSQFEQQRDEWEQQRDEWEQVCAQVEQDLGARDQQIAEREQQLEQTISENEQERAELDRWAAELADERLAIEEARRDAEQRGEGACGAPAQELADAIAERDELAQQLADAELASAAATAALEENNARLAERLKQAEAENSDTLESELQEKFDLALADVERLRSRTTELEQELAERPAPGASEAAELAALRIERDELAEQNERLRSAPSSGDGADSQEVEDLRRRFEMAVEDVRQLKTEKAELEERLGDAGGGDTDGLDWESQKRRLLASLEGDDLSQTPERQEERATIEGTIRITDEVVAEKDRLIAELQEQLANAEAAPAASPDAPDLSDDERLAAERERLTQLEQEWREKLRAAELELSVERAKIAREQAELAEWRMELESRSEQVSAAGEEGKGQRRWLDKLGLGGGE